MNLGSDPDTGRAMHQGLSLHVGGHLSMVGLHSFAACRDAADPILPALRVISHTMPPLEGWVAPLLPARLAPDMPGDRPEQLPMVGEGES